VQWTRHENAGAGGHQYHRVLLMFLLTLPVPIVTLIMLKNGAILKRLQTLIQAIRHVAFVVPAGVGVQEAGLIVFGHIVGISSEMALAVGMVKRIRELAWGIVVGWQWMGRRLRRA
jgi:hypothetical protein